MLIYLYFVSQLMSECANTVSRDVKTGTYFFHLTVLGSKYSNIFLLSFSS